MIPNILLDSSEEKALREKSRMRQVEYSNRGLRKSDVFEPSEMVYLQDEEGHWTVRATIISQRTHQGMSTASYMLKKSKYGIPNNVNSYRISNNGVHKCTPGHDLKSTIKRSDGAPLTKE